MFQNGCIAGLQGRCRINVMETCSTGNAIYLILFDYICTQYALLRQKYSLDLYKIKRPHDWLYFCIELDRSCAEIFAPMQRPLI